MDPPALQERHDLVRAKLVGFTWTPGNIARRVPARRQVAARRYARAILAFRTGSPVPRSRPSTT